MSFFFCVNDKRKQKWVEVEVTVEMQIHQLNFHPITSTHGEVRTISVVSG